MSQSQLEQTANYFRRVISSAPDIHGVAVVGIEDIRWAPDSTRRTLVVDLADGSTVRLDIERFIEQR